MQSAHTENKREFLANAEIFSPWPDTGAGAALTMVADSAP
jgi:hypothetical protein